METKKKLTKKELALLQEEIANRMKNIIFMLADNNAKFCLNKIEDIINVEHRNEPVTITYSINFMINDFLEIIGGIRRNGSKS
jgi:hypothetical protein